MEFFVLKYITFYINIKSYELFYRVFFFFFFFCVNFQKWNIVYAMCTDITTMNDLLVDRNTCALHLFVVNNACTFTWLTTNRHRLPILGWRTSTICFRWCSPKNIKKTITRHTVPHSTMQQLSLCDWRYEGSTILIFDAEHESKCISTKWTEQEKLLVVLNSVSINHVA